LGVTVHLFLFPSYHIGVSGGITERYRDVL
jgi:hypothetical protein